MKIKNLIKILAIAFVFTMATVGCANAFSLRDITLKFVQISDVHLSDREDTSYKMLSSSRLLMSDAIKQVNKIEGLDFIAFTGDMVDAPTDKNYNDFFYQMTESKYPAIFAFGNHEIGGSTGDKLLTKDDMLSILKEYNKNYPFMTGYYAFNPKPGFRIITLDLTQIEGNVSNGRISSEQLAFLDKELRENQNKVIIIFQHFPIIEPFESEHHKVLNADEYLAVLKKYKNPILICSGHYHATKITRDENVIHVSSPALVTYPNAFRYIKITDYKEKTIFDFYFYETTLKDVQAKSRANAVAIASFQGAEKDRLTTITINKKIKKEKKNKSEKTKE